MTAPPLMPENESARREIVRVLRENWREELVIARVYRTMAEDEKNARRRELMHRMADSEEEHASLWAERLAALGEIVNPDEVEGDYQKQYRVLRHFGTDAMIRRIEREERGHVADYQAQIKSLGDPESAAILERVIPDEEAHAERLHQMAMESQTGPRSKLDSLLAVSYTHLRAHET